MTLVAALASGTFVYLLVATLRGRPPTLTMLADSRRARASRRRLWLQQAGSDLTPRQFRIGSAFLGATVFALVTTATSAPMVAVVPAVATAVLPHAWFAKRRVRRLREVQEAWPDGLRDLVAAIAAGTSLSQALTALATNGPAPLQRAFERFPLLARMVGVVPALEIIKEELGDPTSDRIIEVLILAYERGGQIVTQVLRDLAQATTRDLRTLEEMETDALEQRINARAVFVLPWLALLAITLRPGPIRDFYRSPAGALVIAAGALLSLLGMWLVVRLGREPIEQRVLASGERAAG